MSRGLVAITVSRGLCKVMSIGVTRVLGVWLILLCPGVCANEYWCRTCPRGLVAISILKRLEALCGQPIHQLFDFVCGTSTGAILAVLLCLEKLNAQQCKEYYQELSTEVFKMNNLLGISQFLLNHAFYDSKLLERAIR